MLRLLDAFSQHVVTRDLLLLKGGTAIHLFCGATARLSQDIDMNLLDADAGDPASAAPVALHAAFVEIAASVRARYTPRTKHEHALSTHVFTFVGHDRRQLPVTVQVNHQFRRALFPAERLDSAEIRGVRSRGTAIVSFPELSAGKLCALLDRCEPRDVFDVAELGARIVADIARTRLAFIVLSTASRRLDLRRCRPWTCPIGASTLSEWARDSVLSGAGAIDGDWQSWAQRIMAEAVSTVDRVLPRAEAELDFLSQLLDRGQVRPDLLSDDPRLLAVIAAHPGVEWRAQNVRRQIARGTERSAK